jgi:hypothetical protein
VTPHIDSNPKYFADEERESKIFRNCDSQNVTEQKRKFEKITLEARWKIRIKIEQININGEYVIKRINCTCNKKYRCIFQKRIKSLKSFGWR